MKINEIEQMVGITKKNIRFYEEQGLIKPARNSANGYREYAEEDVYTLARIKLLRRLNVPIEEIRQIITGRLTLSDCMERHLVMTAREEENIRLVSDICGKIRGSGESFSSLDASALLGELEELEKGGARFVNVKKSDVKVKKRGAVASAAVIIALIVLWVAAILFTGSGAGLPPFITALIVVLPAAVIIGLVIALLQRIKELNGGEEDEASDY
jgi:DNA-binding transcriptional MerR regulator